MKKKLALIVSLVMLSATLLTACGGRLSGDSGSSSGGEGAESGDEPIVIRLATEDPQDNQWGQGATHFKELVEEKSEGKVQIEIYFDGQLGHGGDNIEQLQTATLEMTIVGSDIADMEQFFQVFDLPYLFKDRDHAKKVLTDDEVLDKCNEYLASHGLVMLGMWENGFRQITNSKKPIVVPEDLAGLDIRTPESEIRVKMFKSYGANPVVMAFSELYTSLQQNVIDGQENPYGNIWGDKLFEVQKYISHSDHVFTPINVLIAKEYFDSLDPEIQDILMEAARETTPWQMDWAASQEADWIKDFEDYGCELNEVDKDAFVAASQPIWDDFRAAAGEDVSAFIDKIEAAK